MKAVSKATTRSSPCAVCGPPAKVEKFSVDWNALLRQYELADFHMSRASRYSRSWGNVTKQSLAERIEAIRPFTDCLGDNLEMGSIEAWDVKGFKAIPPEAKIKVGNPQDPYYLAFARALLGLADYAKGDNIFSLICDDDEETAWNSYRHYRGLRRASERVRKNTASISFADDKFFPALQAADMVAFLTRHEAREQFFQIRNEWLPLFDYMVRNRGAAKMQWQKMFADEQMAMNCLRPASTTKR